MAGISEVFQSVVKLAHQLRRFDVHGVLVAKRSSLDADQKRELLDVPRKVREANRDVRIFFQIVEFEALEIADEDVTRKLGVP